MEREITAKLKYLRIAPRKVRMVADLIRGKDVSWALSVLAFLPKRAARPIRKLLRSAIANAKNNFQIDDAGLYVAKIFVDEGPKLKRWRPRAMGRAYGIQKKTSHITVVLKKRGSEKKETKTLKKKEKKEKKQ